MSNMLVNISSEKAVSLPNAAANSDLPLELRALAQPQQSSSITDHQSLAFFSGTVIQGGEFSVTINTVNQSPKITHQKTGPRKDSASCPAVLMKIKGVLFFLNKLFYKKYRILIFF